MLKWLRKYNTWILVIGGALLMIAFLLPQTIQELGRRRLTGPVMKLDGVKVSHERAGKAGLEYFALRQLVGRGGFDPVSRLVENSDHWILLTHEVEKAGLAGGPADGREMLDQIIREFGQMGSRMLGQDQAAAETMVRTQINNMLPSVLAETRMTEDELYGAFAKLRGVLRLRSLYQRAPRFSDRRVITGAQQLIDAAKIDYVFIPADRETGGLPEPDQATMQAHFDKYRAAAPGTGEFGIGYEQPERVKLEWIALDRTAIKDAVSADAVEVEKRFLRKHPTGEVPAGVDAAAERAAISAQVLEEQADRVLRTADQTVRAEIDKIVRRLEQDGDYRIIPEGFKRIDLKAIADIVVRRVAEAHEVTIPTPRVVVQDQRWLTRADIGLLEGIGLASLQRGSRNETFPNAVFTVREIAPSRGASSFQVGLPNLDPVTDRDGNKYYFTILDARKVSPPDTMAEVADQVRRDILRLAGFEKLKGKVDELRARAGATPNGLEEIAAPAADAQGDAARPLIVKPATVDQRRFIPDDADADVEAVREAVLGIARGLDPTADAESVELARRVAAVAVPSRLGVVVARVKGLSPITVETLREMQMQVISRLQQDELTGEDLADPFSLKAMEKRLNVEYLGNREKSEETAEGEKPAA